MHRNAWATYGTTLNASYPLHPAPQARIYGVEVGSGHLEATLSVSSGARVWLMCDFANATEVPSPRDPRRTAPGC